MVSRTYGLTMRFNAPLSYTYRWCTDYREDDYKISGETSRRHIMEASARKYAWVVHSGSKGKGQEKIRIVTLSPPNGWHLEGYGDEYNIDGDYVLKRLGPRETELKMKFRMLYKTIPPESKEEFVTDLEEEWEKFRKALEKDYAAGR